MLTGLTNSIVQFVYGANASRTPQLGELEFDGIKEVCASAWVMYTSAFNAIGAAFGTAGYYIHADLLEFINGPFEKWAILIYMGAVVGGLVGMAMGQPPKLYLWYFMGPVVFHWLIGTTASTDGMAWMVGNHMQDQRQVWKHAQIPVFMSNYAKRKGITMDIGDDDDLGGPSKPVEVAMPFLWLHTLVTDTVRQMVNWTGVLNHQNDPNGSSHMRLQYPGVLEFDNGEVMCGDPHPNFSVLSNLKWTFLHNVASAKISNTHARDAFARFMANECGDKFNEAIDDTMFATAAHTKGAAVPPTVFKTQGDVTPNTPFNYNVLKRRLMEQMVPMPRSLKKMFEDIWRIDESGYHSFVTSVNWGEDNQELRSVLRSERVSCDIYFDILVLYFRYEAALIYVQGFANSLPSGWTSKHAAYNFLYGWDIEPRTGNTGSTGNFVTTPDQERFIQDLIFVHLVRNEMALVPKKFAPNLSGSQLVALHGESFNRTLGSVSKFAEVYTWALMIPYVQGILIYLLALAYPLAAIFVLIPGWHKIMFTWASFLIWVTLWDLGFAIVTSLERPIWAMLGNTDDAAAINKRVLEMQESGAAAWAYEACDTPCISPTIYLKDGAIPPGFDTGSFSSDAALNVTNLNVQGENMRLFDIALSVGANLDYDLANSYYIYLMAALYFAVPAVTGQLVLGAKAGAASMVDRIASDPAQKAAGGAQSGLQGAKTQQLLSNRASVAQAAMAKGYRKSGLAHAALGHQNKSAEEGLRAAERGQQQEGLQRIANARIGNQQMRGRHMELAQKIFTSALAGGKPSGSDAGLDEAGGESQGANANASQIQGGGGPGGGTPPGHKPKSLSEQSSPNGGAASYDTLTAQGRMRGEGNGLSALGKLGRKYKVFKPGSSLDRALNFGGDFLNKHTYEGILGVTGAAHGADVQDQMALADNEGKAGGAAAGIAGFAHNQRSSGYRSAGERSGAMANFAAQEARYDALNQMANQLSSEATIAGYQPGGMDPGQRPDDMTGMAMRGMLDTNRNRTKDQAGYFNPYSGGFFKSVQGSERSLHKNFGYHRQMGELQQTTWSREFGRSLGNAKTHVGGGMYGGPKNGNQN